MLCVELRPSSVYRRSTIRREIFETLPLRGARALLYNRYREAPMDENKDMIAANVKALREEKGWTQAELGEKIFVSDKLVSKWERGESVPDTDTVVRLAELAGKSVGEFTGGEKLWSEENVTAPAVKRRLVYNAVSFIADLGIVAFLVAMWAIAIREYSSLPEVIGIHFGLNGEADGFGGKGFVFLMPALSTAAAASAILFNSVKMRWSINLVVPVYLDTVAEGKEYEKLLKIMSIGVNITILLIVAMFFQAAYSVAMQVRIVMWLYLGWIGLIVVTVFACVAAGIVVVKTREEK